MGLLNFSRKAHENAHPASPEVVAGPTEADADIDMREVYFLIMHFLSSGPCQRTFGQIWNELLEHDLLPRRYHAWHSRSGSCSSNKDDNGHSLPLSYTDLVSRHPHIETNHLVKLLKQLILYCSSASNGSLGGSITSGVDISSLLGSSAFSLLGSDKTREVKKATHLPLYLRWPHIQANQVHGLSLREIGGGFSKHCRAPSIRAACYAIAKPSTMVQKMEDIRKLRGHQNAVYCAIFDRSGRYVITGSDDRLVKIWSMETAFCLSSCRGHEGDITDFAVSSNNSLVASASNDFSIRIWRLPDGLPISVLKGHTGGVTAIAFSPRPVTMYHLLSSSDDGTCRIWDSRYSNPSLRVYVPKPPDGVPGRSSNATSSSVPQVHQILCCAYNANGTVFATGSSDTYARVWSASFRTNAEDAEQPYHEMDLLSGHENDVNYVQFSGCAVSSKLYTGDTSKEDNLPKFKNSWFTHDNIVTCSRDGSAIIWIPRSRRSHGKVGRWTRAYHLKVPPPPMPPQPPRGGPRQRSQPAPRGVNMIVWSLDNRFVLAAIMDCRICVWNASDGSLVHSLIGHSESTFVLDVHPFNPRIAMSAGYDGKTIIWDIWEGIPVRTYVTGRFKLVDGKFSPDGTSVVLSDEVGQIFIIATGQGESQKDAKYDQFFLGDYRPLMQDAHGNTLDQETQLTPYRRNMQDLLCDSSKKGPLCMIPYPEPYQSEYQRRRLGALGIEWRPPSLKFAVGPSSNGGTGEYHQILPIVDLERWIESLEAMPEFVDAMDWEQENEAQSDDNDSEYNVTEEFSSGREHFSLTVSSSGGLGSTGEESEGNHSGREGLRRSRRKNSKVEIEFTTSGRKIKRRNLDEHDDPTTRIRKRKRRNGGSNVKKGSSKLKLHRPQRRAAQNARTFLSQMGGASSEGEEDDYGTYSSDNDSPIPESNNHSNDSDRPLFDSWAEVACAKEIKKGEQDVSRSSLNEAYSSVGSKRRLVLRLPVRDPKKILSSENAISISDKQNDPMVPSAKCGTTDDKHNNMYSSPTGPGDSCMEKSNNVTSQNATGSTLEVEDTGKKEHQPDITFECTVGKVRWGEVKTRTVKRVRTGDFSMTDTWHMGSEDPHAVSGINGHRISENGFQASSSSSHLGNQANGDASFKGECHSEEQLIDCNQDATNVTQNQEPASVNPLVLDHVSANADLIQTDVHAASSNGTRRKIDQPISDDLSIEGFRDSDARQLSSHSQDGGGNAEPTIRRMIKFTSKRSICGTRSSFSKCTPDINDQRNLDDDLNGITQAPVNMIHEVAEEDTRSSGSSDHDNWINGSRKFSRMHVCGRTRSSRGKRSAGENLQIMEENTSKIGNHDDSQYVAITDNSTAKVHFTRSSGARTIVDKPSSSRRRGNYDSAEDAHKIGRSSDASDQLHDDRRSTKRVKVGLRSSRNTGQNYVAFGSSPLDKGKRHYLGKKVSWLMLAEHDEGYRYIPQLGDEVAYLRQGHAEYLAATKSHESGPWKSLKGELRAVEFCKVVLLDYSTLPGSGESCCKLTLEIVDPSSCFVGKSFRLTLPELVGFPDFLVERTRYSASIERNWTHRDKCRVWWRDGDNEGGQWYGGRITSTKAKSNEFPESPWDRYIIQYKNDSSGQHPHSPWELHDADSHWEHPRIEEEDRRELLSSFHKIEQTAQRNKDSHGLLKLNQVTQKSEFLNRFPVPLSLEVIMRRLENNYYRTLEAVRHDITVMLSNAESYFSKSAEYAAKMGKLREFITCAFETKQGRTVL